MAFGLLRDGRGDPGWSRSLAGVSGQALESEAAVSSTLRARGQCFVFEVWPGGTGTQLSKPFLALPALEALEEVRGQGGSRAGGCSPRGCGEEGT